MDLAKYSRKHAIGHKTLKTRAQVYHLAMTLNVQPTLQHKGLSQAKLNVTSSDKKRFKKELLESHRPT